MVRSTLATAALAVMGMTAAHGQTVISGVITGVPAPTAGEDMSSDPWCVDNATAAPAPGSGIIVFVADAPASPAMSAPAVLDQRGCQYTPAVIGLHTGQELLIRNSDATLHNVHVSPERNRGFNIGQPLRGLESRRTFDTAELAVPVKCDIHGWMNGHLFVFDHPIFTVADQAGRYTLPALPDGTWTVTAWHGSGLTASQSVTVSGGAAEVSLRLSR